MRFIGSGLLVFVSAAMVLSCGEAPDEPSSQQTLSGKLALYYPLDEFYGGITCDYDCYSGHSALDMSTWPGKRTVRAAVSGTLSLHPNSGGCGNEARIQHSSGYSVRYCHFSSYLRGGGWVSVGEPIAISGATGYTEPPGADHVHFELRNPSGVRIHPGCPPGAGGNCNDGVGSGYWAVKFGRVAFAWEAGSGGDHDFDGNGCSDILARRKDDASLRLYGGNCAGGYASEGKLIGTSWGDFDQLLLASDWNGDGCADVIGRRKSDASLRLYAGNCGGGWKQTNVAIGNDWGDFDTLAIASDWNGDGCADVIGRRKSDASLRLYAGNCAGGWKQTNVAIGNGWGDFDQLVVRDWNGDGCEDVIGRRQSDASLRLYAGNCAGGFAGQNAFIGSGWSVMDRIF